MVTCKDCYFWKETGTAAGVKVGECHRYPPAALVATANVPSNYPITRETGWCGELKTNDKPT